MLSVMLMRRGRLAVSRAPTTPDVLFRTWPAFAGSTVSRTRTFCSSPSDKLIPTRKGSVWHRGYRQSSPINSVIPHTLLSTSTPLPTSSSSEDELKRERIVTVPNLLCVSRIAAAPLLAHLIIDKGDFPLAVAVFFFAGLTDVLDGFIARKVPGQASSLGSFLDPLADKVLVTALYLSLTYVGIIPPALTSLVVSRDVLLVYAGLYIRYMSVAPPFSVKKYFDVSLPTAQVQPPTISKVNTVFQFALIGAALTTPVFGLQNHPAFNGLCVITACTTFASAVSYAFMRDTYKFSQREYDHQFGKKLAAFLFYIGFNVAFYFVAVNSLRDEKALTVSSLRDEKEQGTGSRS